MGGRGRVGMSGKGETSNEPRRNHRPHPRRPSPVPHLSPSPNPYAGRWMCALCPGISVWQVPPNDETGDGRSGGAVVGEESTVKILCPTCGNHCDERLIRKPLTPQEREERRRLEYESFLNGKEHKFCFLLERPVWEHGRGWTCLCGQQWVADLDGARKRWVWLGYKDENGSPVPLIEPKS